MINFFTLILKIFVGRRFQKNSWISDRQTETHSDRRTSSCEHSKQCGDTEAQHTCQYSSISNAHSSICIASSGKESKVEEGRAGVKLKRGAERRHHVPPACLVGITAPRTWDKLFPPFQLVLIAERSTCLHKSLFNYTHQCKEINGMVSKKKTSKSELEVDKITWGIGTSHQWWAARAFKAFSTGLKNRSLIRINPKQSGFFAKNVENRQEIKIKSESIELWDRSQTVGRQMQADETGQQGRRKADQYELLAAAYIRLVSWFIDHLNLCLHKRRFLTQFLVFCLLLTFRGVLLPHAFWPFFIFWTTLFRCFWCCSHCRGRCHLWDS